MRPDETAEDGHPRRRPMQKGASPPQSQRLHVLKIFH